MVHSHILPGGCTVTRTTEDRPSAGRERQGSSTHLSFFLVLSLRAGLLYRHARGHDALGWRERAFHARSRVVGSTCTSVSHGQTAQPRSHREGIGAAHGSRPTRAAVPPSGVETPRGPPPPKAPSSHSSPRSSSGTTPGRWPRSSAWSSCGISPISVGGESPVWTTRARRGITVPEGRRPVAGALEALSSSVLA